MTNCSPNARRDVIPFAIDQFKAKGYKLVTVSECLGGLPDYQRVRSRDEKDVSTLHRTET